MIDFDGPGSKLTLTCDHESCDRQRSRSTAYSLDEVLELAGWAPTPEEGAEPAYEGEGAWDIDEAGRITCSLHLP